MLKRSLCAAVMLITFTVSAAASDITVEYDSIGGLVRQGNPTYIQAKKTISNEESRLEDLKSQVSSLSLSTSTDWTSAINSTKQIASQETSVKDQTDSLESTYEQQFWQAQSLFLTHYVLAAELEQQQKTLESLKTQRSDTAKKVELGVLAKSTLKSLDTQITTQEKTVSQAKSDVADNLNSLKTQLGLKDDIVLGDMPELDVSSIPERDYDADLAAYLKNLPSIVSQRKKLESISDTYDYRNAVLQLQKLTSEANDAFPSQYSSLQDKYESWKDLEDSIEDKLDELADLQKQFELGNASRKKLTDKQNEIDTLIQNQYAGKIELYQAMRRYENTLLGI